MQTILRILIKEFLQLRRDKRLLPMLFVPPVMQLIILGYAANMDVNSIKTVVCDMDKTATSREFLAQFSNSGYFAFQNPAETINDIDRELDEGRAALAIVIPRNFSNDLSAKRPASVQLIVDGSETSLATAGLSYSAMIIQRYSQNIMTETLERLKKIGIKPARIAPETRVWYNPELKSRNFMVPSILALILMIMTMMLTSLAIVKEKEVGTMEQLIVTPIRPYQLIIGKLAPFALVGLIEVILIVGVTALWFGIIVKGSVVLLFALCMIFLMTTLGLGLLVSTISQNQQQAMMISMFFVMLPMLFLSGFVFPIENMPEIIQWFSAILPLRYFFIIIRGLFLKGIGMEELWDETLILFLFGVVILGLSAFQFRKKLG